MRRLITKTIEDRLADLMLSGELEGAAGISCDFDQSKGEYNCLDLVWPGEEEHSAI